MLEPDTLAEVERLPKKQQVLWVGSRRPTAAQLEDHGPLDLMIWLDSKAQKIRTGMVVPRNQGPEALAVALLQAMLEPAEDLRPFRPGSIAVEDAVSRTYLAGELQRLDIQLVDWPGSTMLDEAFANLEHTLSRGPGITYLDKPGNTPELMRSFFEASVRLFDAAPWEGREDTQLLRVDGLQPSPLFVSLLGGQGIEYGLALYLTSAAAKAALAQHEADTPDAVLLLSYSHPGDMGPGVLVEASDHDWPMVDAECLPLLVRPDREDLVGRGDEIRLAVDVIDTVLGYFAATPSPSSVVLSDGRTVSVRWPAQP
jgi:hypothetical protein